jgi:hypothetical protein
MICRMDMCISDQFIEVLVRTYNVLMEVVLLP